MENNKNRNRIILISLLVIILVSITIGITYAFFNYTRTGLANNIGTGRIYFNTSQNGRLNLTNIFPVKSTDVNANTLDSVTVAITGDTTYEDGEEFQITLVDVQNTVNGKQIPINYIATYTANTDAVIGTSSDTYFTSRESKDANIYLLNGTGAVEENKQVLVGYIDNGQAGINGILTIKAYVDADRIAISDTYDSTNPGSDNMGTTTSWVDGRTVFTTEEWNSFQSSGTPISFKIKAESNEGIWVLDPNAGPVNACTFDVNTVQVATYDINKEACVSAFGSPEMLGDYADSICSGQTIYSEEEDIIIDFDIIVTMTGMTYEQLQEQGIINNLTVGPARELKLGMKYVNGQYTYDYRGNGWHVELTDKESTDSVTTTLCTRVNNYPIVSMSYMFSGSQATSIDLSSFNTSNVNNMSYMFYNSQATSIDFNGFDTSNVTDMGQMFYGSNVVNLDLSNFDTSSVTNMAEMFYESQATSLDLSSFNTSNVTSMSNMFYGSQAITIFVSNLWNTNNVTKSYEMFNRSHVVGSNGTKVCNWNNNSCSSTGNPTDVTYARIDNAPDSPGYFTYKAAPNN